MLKKILNKFRKNRVEKKPKEVIQELVEQGKEHLEKLKKIDQKILTIQKSTKTTFYFFGPIHNYCSTRYSWYYNWHAKPYATKVHAGVLALILVSSLAVGSVSLFSNPHSVMAADYSCTLNATGNWNDTTKWDNCNGEYPGQTEATVYDVVIPTGMIVTLNVNNLNINNTDNTAFGNISITGTLTTSNNNLTLGSMTINAGGRLTAGSSTLTVGGSWARSGVFTAGTSNVTFTGAVGSSTINNAVAGQWYDYGFHDITISGSISIANFVYMIDAGDRPLLTLSGGTLSATNNGYTFIIYCSAGETCGYNNTGATFGTGATEPNITFWIDSTASGNPSIIPGGTYPSLYIQGYVSATSTYAQFGGDITSTRFVMTQNAGTSGVINVDTNTKALNITTNYQCCVIKPINL